MSAFQLNQTVSVIHHHAGWKTTGKVIFASARKITVRFFHPQFQNFSQKDFTAKGEEYGAPNKNFAACIRKIEE